LKAYLPAKSLQLSGQFNYLPFYHTLNFSIQTLSSNIKTTCGRTRNEGELEGQTVKMKWFV